MDFLGDENGAGQTLLRLVSRGSAIIAELLRLSDHIPSVFKLETKADRDKYQYILLDFKYLKQSEYHEQKIEDSAELLDLDAEFRDNHIEIIKRFYNLFESIYKYSQDLVHYLSDLEQGLFIQQTLESVLLNVDGKQLLAEALYLYGVMLLLLDNRIEGIVRERIFISFLRYRGQSETPLLDEVCHLIGSTGYSPTNPFKKPPQYPEIFFARTKIPTEFVSMLVARLRSDDIYNQISSYPLPEHRSIALATQACMLYVILFFNPDILHKEQAVMREIVDKHFPDNWVIAYYLGFTVDLSIEWQTYKAAALALSNTISPQNMKRLQTTYFQKVGTNLKKLDDYLSEGVLVPDFVLSSTNELMACLRDSNVTIRWLILHTNGSNKKLRDMILTGFEPERLLLLLLRAAQFEFVLKNIFTGLLETKQAKWDACKKEGVERMKEMAEYFSGEKALTRVKKNENLQNWFNEIADKVENLDYNDSTKAGRKIHQLIQALEGVEQFQEIESSEPVKHFLRDTRSFLGQMVKIVQIKEEGLVTISLVGDISYAWEIIDSYVVFMQKRIKEDPSSVLLLRATFLKLASILELPLIRINQASSPDFFSVSEYYSGQLVAYIRKVLEVVPKTMFETLKVIIQLQTNAIKEIPTKPEKDSLREYAQLDDRFQLAKATYSVSVFTEGILAMQTTFVGTIKIEPQKLLEDGIRKELVRYIAQSMNKILVFPTGKIEDLEKRLQDLASRLDGFRRSFQYIQDYVNIYGLKIWQEEFSRIIHFNVEQECNSFLKKKIYEWQSAYQSTAIPIPVFPPSDDKSVNFIGRLAREFLLQTDPRKTVFLDQQSGWWDRSFTKEIVGIRTFTLLFSAVEVFSVTGLDKLLSFMIVRELQAFTKQYRKEVDANMKAFLKELRTSLEPSTTLPPNANRLYYQALNKTSRLWPFFIEQVTRIGQMQLLRRQISNLLNFTCKLDSNLLYSNLNVFNQAILTDVKAHYLNPDLKPYPSDENEVLPELTKYLESVGINDPFTKIYFTTTDQLVAFPLVMFLFVLSQSPSFSYNQHLAILQNKSRSGYDHTPYVVGIMTVLKHFHPIQTQKFLSFLGQYIRANIHHTDKEKGLNQFPFDISNVLIFLEEFCKFSNLSRKNVEGYLPAYIFNHFPHQ